MGGPPEICSKARRAEELRPHGVDLPGLEQTLLENLPFHRRRTHVRLDGPAAGRAGAESICKVANQDHYIPAYRFSGK